MELESLVPLGSDFSARNIGSFFLQFEINYSLFPDEATI